MSHHWAVRWSSYGEQKKGKRAAQRHMAQRWVLYLNQTPWCWRDIRVLISRKPEPLGELELACCHSHLSSKSEESRFLWPEENLRERKMMTTAAGCAGVINAHFMHLSWKLSIVSDITNDNCAWIFHAAVFSLIEPAPLRGQQRVITLPEETDTSAPCGWVWIKDKP